MNTLKSSPTSQDPWQNLRQFTSARIALGRAGMSLPTQACLEFQLAHALARDAVHIPLDFSPLSQRLETLWHPVQILQSQAENQTMYLQRPDLGRLLDTEAIATLKKQAMRPVDAVIVIADGLSSKAITHHAEPFLRLLLPALQENAYQLAPLTLIKHGRVAIGDEVADHYNARLCITLIGERPGLSSPDSMGIYFTYQAKANFSTDANRNCISNIHDKGLRYEQALKKLLFLIHEAEKLKFSGVNLKDETTDIELETLDSDNFLLT